MLIEGIFKQTLMQHTFESQTCKSVKFLLNYGILVGVNGWETKKMWVFWITPNFDFDKNLSEIEVALLEHTKTETFNFFAGEIGLGTVHRNWKSMIHQEQTVAKEWLP